MRVGSFTGSLLFSQIFHRLDMVKNIWEQISSALECRETGEPLNTIPALFASQRLPSSHLALGSP